MALPFTNKAKQRFCRANKYSRIPFSTEIWQLKKTLMLSCNCLFFFTLNCSSRSIAQKIKLLSHANLCNVHAFWSKFYVLSDVTWVLQSTLSCNTFCLILSTATPVRLTGHGNIPTEKGQSPHCWSSWKIVFFSPPLFFSFFPFKKIFSSFQISHQTVKNKTATPQPNLKVRRWYRNKRQKLRLLFMSKNTGHCSPISQPNQYGKQIKLG